jgi:aminoglycoside 6'-N-acetyltransferase I
MTITPLTQLPDTDWLRMRQALWPEGSAQEHLDEMGEFLSQPTRFGQFMARSAAGEALGFVEVAVRTDYVNGTASSPVGFLEGVYVEPAARRQGVARALIRAAAAWARAQGCAELASDTLLDNTQSQAVHRCLGFVETERVVYFALQLEGGS